MTGSQVLVTTAFLREGDAVHRQLTAAGLDVAYCPGLESLPAEKQAGTLAGVEAVIAGTAPFTAESMDRAPLLKIIARTGVGFDSVDVEAATARGIRVCITPGANRQSVAELVFTLMLAGARALPQDLEHVRAGRWPQNTGRELRGATLGIVGLGSIGRAVATIASGFGMNVLAYDPYLDAAFAAANDIAGVDLDTLLRESDFVSLHVFLDPSTRHLIDHRALSLMRPDAFLVNTSRGGIVDEAALLEAVQSGRLAGAGLDVFETEPLPLDSPLQNEPRIITSGHIAGATREARARSGEMAARSVIDALAGRPVPHAVNESELAALVSKGAAL